MRIQFPNAEHPDITVDGGRVLFGSAVSGPGAISLPALAPQHLAIEFERVRGIWLSVTDGQNDVRVNGRSVRERAYLRLGDCVMAGSLQLLIKPDSDFRELPPPAEEHPRAPMCRAALRAVSGSYFGKILPLTGRTAIGRDRGNDVVLDEPGMPARHSIIENRPDGLFLRDLGASGGALVNGISVLSTVLQPGDQIAFEQNRFIVEAPGWQAQRTPATPPAMPIPPRTSTTQVQRRLVPPPGSQAAALRAAAAAPAEVRRSSQLINWILAIAALVTLVALGTVIFLSVNNGL